jgi:malonyl-CoA/methylmalonyl-CoA synthetase
MKRWEQISGHKLLERFGMTELGMALTNPYKPEDHRLPGYVG